jgi:hypothetical protein
MGNKVIEIEVYKNPNTLTLPSFSGTFGIPAIHHTNQKSQKSLQTLPAPTHVNSLPKQKFSSPWIYKKLIMNTAQPITRYIKHLAESANFKGGTFNKHCNSLIGKRFEIPNVSYVCREAEYRQDNSSACCNKDGGIDPPGLSYRREPQTTQRCCGKEPWY